MESLQCVVGSFIRKGWPFRSVKRIESTVTDLKRCLGEFQEEQPEDDQDTHQWVIDAEVTQATSVERRRASLKQRLPWDL